MTTKNPARCCFWSATPRALLVLFSCGLITGCSNPQPGPDKTLAGAVLGAGWGAGAGAVVGHQTANTGGGVAVGAGLGLAAGAMAGLSQDLTEDAQLKLEEDLKALQVQTTANRNEFQNMQAKLDRSLGSASAVSAQKVYFGEDETDLRAGAVAELQAFADGIKRNPGARRVIISGHTDDTGNPDYNQRLSEARARSVSACLGARGIAMDQIEVRSFGSTRPVATNSTAEGRQLNRRVEITVTR